MFITEIQNIIQQLPIKREKLQTSKAIKIVYETAAFLHEALMQSVKTFQ